MGGSVYERDHSKRGLRRMRPVSLPQASDRQTTTESFADNTRVKRIGVENTGRRRASPRGRFRDREKKKTSAASMQVVLHRQL